MRAATINVYKPIKSQNFRCSNIRRIKNFAPNIFAEFSIKRQDLQSPQQLTHFFDRGQTSSEDFCWRSGRSQNLTKMCFLLTRKFVCLLNRREVFLLSWECFFSTFSNAVVACFCWALFSICLHVGVIWRLRSIDRAFSYRRENRKKKY